jgi:hypothetical protein
MLDRFRRSVRRQPMVLTALISNRDILYWRERPCRAHVRQSGAANALTYDPDYVLTTVPDARRISSSSRWRRYPEMVDPASATMSRLEGNFMWSPGRTITPRNQSGPMSRSLRRSPEQPEPLELKAQLGGLLRRPGPLHLRGGPVNSMFLEMASRPGTPCAPSPGNPGILRRFFSTGQRASHVQPRHPSLLARWTCTPSGASSPGRRAGRRKA